ncbi:hypothetical protein EAKF1_ch0010c [Escherichia albertii KF1]|nr:hypothetical protein EAKF1_ch0010c [Escherichia albertii KF1]
MKIIKTRRGDYKSQLFEYVAITLSHYAWRYLSPGDKV